MTPGLKERTLAAVKAMPAPSRRGRRWISGLIVALAVATSVALFVTAGAVRPTGRPLALVLGTAAGGVTVVVALLAILRGRNPLLAPARALLLAACMGALVLFVGWKVAWSQEFAGMMVPWPTRPGFRCLWLTLALATLPLAATFFVRRATDPVFPAVQGAAWGVAVGLGAAVLTDLWCPVAYVPHLLLGHVTPVVLLAALGYGVGGAVLAMRRPSRR